MFTVAIQSQQTCLNVLERKLPVACGGHRISTYVSRQFILPSLLLTAGASIIVIVLSNPSEQIIHHRYHLGCKHSANRSSDNGWLVDL